MKKKNIIWWTGIINTEHNDKYGGFEYLQYSRKTWEYWCKQNDCEFIAFTEPVEKDLFKFRVNWQKAIFCFDELEKRGIEYDQICLVDSSCMIKWDAPNFFELTDRKFSAWRDLDNMRWTNDSINGYKEFFNFDLDRTKYINSGFIIFNEAHKEFFNSFKQLYYDNVDIFCELQDKIIKKGTEQTPLNYWLQINDIDIKTDLPVAFKLTHLHRKEMFGWNWQLNEDKTPYFIKYGYNWIFNGLPKDQRSKIMQDVWGIVKHNYSDNIIDKVVHKDTHKFTTSKQFKQDILEIFQTDEFKDKTLIELGCCQGTTTRIYAECFKTVIGYDLDKWNAQQAMKTCADVTNTKIICQDLYNTDWNMPQADVVVIDAGHTYEHIMQDVPRVIEYFDNPIIIIDDYGNPNQGIRRAIDELESKGVLKINYKIGADKGYTTATGLVFDNKEGVICNV
jgi:hypothetical protein